MLPSQTTRSSARRRYMYRNQKSRRITMIAGGVGGLLVIVLIWQLFFSGEDTPEDLNAVAKAGEGELTGGTGDVTREVDEEDPVPTLPVMMAPSNDLGRSEEQDKDKDEDKSGPDSIAMGDDPATLETPDASTGQPEQKTESIDEQIDPAEHDGAGTLATPEEKAPPPEQFTTRSVAVVIQQAEMLLRQNKPLEARRQLSDALPTAPRADQVEIKRKLTEINERLVFSPEVVPGDEYTRTYVLQPGDSLSKVVNRLSLPVDWRFLARINGIPKGREHLVRAGDPIKIVTAPFHAVVDKSEHRLDLYLGEDAEIYVRSFKVGLGEFDSTPLGRFKVRPNSKLVNPAWVNPRTREQFEADNPDNPIGERWIGLMGIEDPTRDMAGYGIHGTIDLDSIGKNASMGCIRLGPDDVALIYEVMAEDLSQVRIVK